MPSASDSNLPNSAALTPELLDELRRAAVRTARIAGEKIFQMRQQGVSIAAEKSSPVDVVTEADRASEQLIVQTLLSARPHDGFLGEEGAGREGTTGITWVIDPIDGTTNYVYGIGAYCVSIAATVPAEAEMHDGRRAVAGAVYNPVTRELFSAAQGAGAYRDGTPLRVREAPEELNRLFYKPATAQEPGALSHSREMAQVELTLEQALVGTGFGYTRERKEAQLVLFNRVLPRVRDIRRIGSAALDLCRLAAGEIDVFYEVGLKPWDYHAGLLIAQEAGAEVLGWRHVDVATAAASELSQELPGEPLLVAGHPSFARPLLKTLAGGLPE